MVQGLHSSPCKQWVHSWNLCSHEFKIHIFWLFYLFLSSYKFFSHHREILIQKNKSTIFIYKQFNPNLVPKYSKYSVKYPVVRATKKQETKKKKRKKEMTISTRRCYFLSLIFNAEHAIWLLLRKHLQERSKSLA